MTRKQLEASVAKEIRTMNLKNAVWQWAMNGFTQRQIAEKVGRSERTVRYILNEQTDLLKRSASDSRVDEHAPEYDNYGVRPDNG